MYKNEFVLVQINDIQGNSNDDIIAIAVSENSWMSVVDILFDPSGHCILAKVSWLNMDVY